MKNLVFVMLRMLSLFMLAFTMWTCDSSTVSSSTVDLKADIRKSDSQLLVLNNDYFDWKSVTIEINGEYEFKTEIITAGNEVKIGFLNFVDSDFNKFNPFTMAVGNVTISCKTSTEKEGYVSASFR